MIGASMNDPNAIEKRLRALGITPTIEVCAAYRAGRDDVLGTYELELEKQDQSKDKEQE